MNLFSLFSDLKSAKCNLEPYIEDVLIEDHKKILIFCHSRADILLGKIRNGNNQG